MSNNQKDTEKDKFQPYYPMPQMTSQPRQRRESMKTRPIYYLRLEHIKPMSSRIIKSKGKNAFSHSSHEPKQPSKMARLT